MVLIIKKKASPPPAEAPAKAGGSDGGPKKLVIKGRKAAEAAPNASPTLETPPITQSYREPPKPAPIVRPPHPRPITRENWNPTLATAEDVKELAHPCSVCGKSYIFPCDDDVTRSRVCAGAIWKEQMEKGETPTMAEVTRRIEHFNGPLPVVSASLKATIERNQLPKPKAKLVLKRKV